VLLYLIANNLQWMLLDLSFKKEALGLFYEDRRPGPFNYWGNIGTLLKGFLVPITFLLTIAYYFFKRVKTTKSPPDRRLLYLLIFTIIGYFLYTISANTLYQLLFAATQFSKLDDAFINFSGTACE
jgi:hypothetical protein